MTEAAALAAKILDGIDTNEDGVVEAIAGEGGARAAYEQAYRMADMPLQIVGIHNLGTGTPTFVLVAPSRNFAEAAEAVQLPVPRKGRTPARRKQPSRLRVR